MGVKLRWHLYLLLISILLLLRGRFPFSIFVSLAKEKGQ
jgi:hypothetical protein